MSSKRIYARNLFSVGEYVAAEKQYLKILKKNHKDPEALQLLGTIAFRQGRLDIAEKYFRRALLVSPGSHELYYQLGCIFDRHGEHGEACGYFEHAVKLQYDFTDARLALGNLKARQGLFEEAKKQFRVILSKYPEHIVARNNLANVLASQGDISHALSEWSRVLKLQPGYHAARSNYLLALNYLPDSNSEELFRQHEAWGSSIAITTPVTLEYINEPDPDRPVRVGYVSADFRQHSVSYFIEPILMCHNRDKFKVYCYSNVINSDPVTARLLGYADNVREIVNMSDEAAEKLIKEDRIDVLIDLSGHTDGNRLTLFARKPAPVQFTYLGYPNTTGLRTIDYRLTDLAADPDESDQALYTEKLVRIPGGFLCYSPPTESPEVAELPMHKAGYPTFGVFNNVAKLTDKAVSVWSQILLRADTSRLYFKNRAFSDEGARDRYMKIFEKEGVSPDRLLFSGLTPAKQEYLETYNQIDIALDSFPYNGTTTTFDALWMGVPVVVLSGDRHAGRVGVSILSRVGLMDLVAGNVRQYIDLAVSLARDPARVQEIRASIRGCLAASSLCDGSRVCRELEDAYRHAWAQWCLHGA